MKRIIGFIFLFCSMTNVFAESFPLNFEVKDAEKFKIILSSDEPDGFPTYALVDQGEITSTINAILRSMSGAPVCISYNRGYIPVEGDQLTVDVEVQTNGREFVHQLTYWNTVLDVGFRMRCFKNGTVLDVSQINDIVTGTLKFSTP
ncbi:MAG: hypothetical protein K2Q18_15935 [Bdellovibrionales bacterium]|nr:hypothetical protein [Bdellovibrionales bacterium]